MAFRLRRDARRWFQDISADFDVDFDMYYLCLLAGLAAGGRRSEVRTTDTTELVDYFPGPYKEKGRVIIALFLATEIERIGIAKSDREAVHKQIRELVDPRTPSQLSDQGRKMMNAISSGGFELLTEQFDDRPRSIESFLVRFNGLISSDELQFRE
ncbi:MAG: hypothetical protein WD672_07445 [Woeseia sp.]